MLNIYIVRSTINKQNSKKKKQKQSDKKIKKKDIFKFSYNTKTEEGGNRSPKRI